MTTGVSSSEGGIAATGVGSSIVSFVGRQIGIAAGGRDESFMVRMVVGVGVGSGGVGVVISGGVGVSVGVAGVGVVVVGGGGGDRIRMIAR